MSVETKQLSDQGLTIVDDLIEKGEKSKDNSRFSKNVVNEMIESINKINFISDAITEITEPIYFRLMLLLRLQEQVSTEEALQLLQVR